MAVNIDDIKFLAKKLAGLKMKKFSSLSEIKDYYDSLAISLIDLDSKDDQLMDTLKSASKYFNYLNVDDFKTDDQQKLNESKAVISQVAKVLNSILVKWRKEHGNL